MNAAYIETPNLFNGVLLTTELESEFVAGGVVQATPHASAVDLGRVEAFYWALVGGLLNLPHAMFTGSSLSPNQADRPFGNGGVWSGPSVAHKTGYVREVFGLTIVDLAAVLGVERKTIYSWLDEENEPRLKPRHAARLQAVYLIAAEWVKDELGVGSRLFNTEILGTSLKSLLCAEVIDRSEVYRLFDSLRSLARMPSKQPSLADQLDALGFAMPPSTSKSAADDFVRDVPIE